MSNLIDQSTWSYLNYPAHTVIRLQCIHAHVLRWREDFKKISALNYNVRRLHVHVYIIASIRLSIACYTRKSLVCASQLFHGYRQHSTLHHILATNQTSHTHVNQVTLLIRKWCNQTWTNHGIHHHFQHCIITPPNYKIEWLRNSRSTTPKVRTTYTYKIWYRPSFYALPHQELQQCYVIILCCVLYYTSFSWFNILPMFVLGPPLTGTHRGFMSHPQGYGAGALTSSQEWDCVITVVIKGLIACIIIIN